MSSGKVLLGVLAGLAAGALIGILFAPDKGSETRKKIVKKGEEYADEIKEKINSLLDDLSLKRKPKLMKWHQKLRQRLKMPRYNVGERLKT